MAVVPLWLLQLTLLIMVCTAVVLLGIIVMARARRTLRARRSAALVAPLRPHLLEVAAGEDDERASLRVLTDAPEPARRLLDEAIISLLSKLSGPTARSLAEVLRRHGVRRQAVARLSSRSAVRRAHAAWTIGVLREDDLTARLEPLLQDRSLDVAIATTRALGLIGRPRSALAILEAVAPTPDRTGVPPWAAVEALTALGPAGQDVVGAALDHPAPETRTVAAIVVAQVPLFGLAGRVRARLQSEDDATVVSALADALGTIGGGADVSALGEVAQDDERAHVRRVAVRALQRLGDPRGVAWLEPLVTSGDVRVAEAATVALTGCGAPGLRVLSAHAASTGPAAAASRYALALTALRTGERPAHRSGGE